MQIRTAVASFLLAGATGAFPQLAPPNAAGVGMGHLHLNVRDPAAHRAFWITLGGKPVKFGSMEVILFPDVLVLFQKAEPTGGTDGSVVGHVGFRVKDLHASLDKWRAAGLKILPRRQPRYQAYVIAPDEIKVEVHRSASMEVPIANHHIHFYTASVDETKAWYVKMFGAKPGKRSPFGASRPPRRRLPFPRRPAP